MTIISTNPETRRETTYDIVETVAEETGTDVRELPPLYETVDPDALVAVLGGSSDADARPPRSVEFSYCGLRVTVDSRGDIQLDPEADSTSSTPPP